MDAMNDPSKSTNEIQSEQNTNESKKDANDANDANDTNNDCSTLSESQSKFLTLPKHSSTKHSKKKAILLVAPSSPIVETIGDDISTTTEDIKRLKHVQVRSNSTGKLYQSSRRVSFPENDSELVTGYLEPADPWACG